MFVADCHCDTIGAAALGECGLITPYNAAEEPHLQIYAAWTEFPEEQVPEPYCGKADSCKALLDFFVQQYHFLLKKQDELVHCAGYDGVMQALAAGKSAAMLSVEGCQAIASVDELARLYGEGVRFAGLTWNQNNRLGCGADATGTGSDTGLTSYGKEFVRACEQLGIVIDVSHASDKTVDDILLITSRPVYASHSNFRALCGHPRNLRREHSDEIVSRGGFIGLNLYYPFVKENISLADFRASMLFEHLDYALQAGYGDHLGFGLDIDGVGSDYPPDICLAESIHAQYIARMREAGYDETLIEKISGKNFLAFLKRYDRV